MTCRRASEPSKTHVDFCNVGEGVPEVFERSNRWSSALVAGSAWAQYSGDMSN